MTERDVIIVGAGAAGLHCAIETARRGRKTLVIEHNPKPGEKIRISGGGRCNFTNTHTTPKAFISANPHFCVSALKRFTPTDFISKVDGHGIAWHEKTLGQLFCDSSAQQIIDMLVGELTEAGGELQLSTSVTDIRPIEGEGARFSVHTSTGTYTCQSLIVATGGKSIPKMGASDFAYRLAAQFEIPVVETRPGLVPLTFTAETLEAIKPLSGLSTEARVSYNDTVFEEALLFTHRGLSGPAILQISSYWREGTDIEINLTPETDLKKDLRQQARENGKQAPQTALASYMPKRLAQLMAERAGFTPRAKLAELSAKQLDELANSVNQWHVRPQGTEGYRTAEVTLGGIDTQALSSRTMETREWPGLYFIGEAVDVTGWLGGYNFQWAWSSSWAAGQVA